MTTVFSTKDPNPGVWFKFDKNDPESGEIRIRAVNQAKRSEIQKKCVKKKVEYKHGQRFEYTDTKDDLFSEMLWEYSIAEWSGLVDDDGKELVCDTETKVFLMQNNVGFARFVSDCLDKLNEDEENRIARVKKTSLTGSPGSKKSPTASDVKS
jgi:hypothetical protein